MPAVPGGEAIDRALCRSALYETLTIGFRPPTRAGVERLAGPRGAAALEAAAELVGGPVLASALRRLVESDTRLDVLERAHRRLFAHTVRSETPGYETEYGGGDLFRQPQELADLAGFYAAFGLTVASGAAERPDHVSCECEFAMFLARKEALALERGDEEMLEETRRAERLFLRDHLARFLPALGERLGRAGGSGFYPALGALAVAFVAEEWDRFGVTPGSASLPLRVTEDDNVPMACGGCELACDGGGHPDAD